MAGVRIGHAFTPTVWYWAPAGMNPSRSSSGGNQASHRGNKTRPFDVTRANPAVSILARSAASAPMLAAFAIPGWLGWSVVAFLVGLSVTGLDAPRPIGAPTLHRVPTSRLPVISAEPLGLPIAHALPDGQDFFALVALVEWSHTPGCFPRPAMFLRQATPERRFWLLAVGGRGLGDVTTDWLRVRLPSAVPCGLRCSCPPATRACNPSRPPNSG